MILFYHHRHNHHHHHHRHLLHYYYTSNFFFSLFEVFSLFIIIIIIFTFFVCLCFFDFWISLALSFLFLLFFIVQLLYFFLTPCTFYSTVLYSLLLLWSQLLLGGPGIPLTMLSNNSSDFDLTIRQQPDRARVAGGKEKGMSSLYFGLLLSCFSPFLSGLICLLARSSSSYLRSPPPLSSGVGPGLVLDRRVGQSTTLDGERKTGLAIANALVTERKPIDPPPIVQLRVRQEDSYLAQ